MAEGVTRTFEVDADYRAKVVVRLCWFAMGRMLSTFVALLALEALGLALLIRTTWVVAVMPVPLAVILVISVFLSIRQRTRRVLPVGTVLSSRFDSHSLVIADGLVTSSISYSLIRSIEGSRGFATIRTTRSPRIPVFFPIQLFPFDEIRKASARFASATLSSADSPRPRPGTPG